MKSISEAWFFVDSIYLSVALCPFLLFANVGLAEEPSSIEAVMAMIKEDDHEAALASLAKMIQAKQNVIQARLVRIRVLQRLERWEESLEDWDELVELNSQEAGWLQERGHLRLKLGDASGALEDYDRAIDIEPRLKQNHWQRGLACYYRGKFAEGAEQFAVYQSYDDSDVENVVWRFLCQAKTDGIDRAREDMMELGRHDRRTPLMKVDALYRGNGTVEAVLEDFPPNQIDEKWERYHRFYGHLYLGLYFDAIGDGDQCSQHIFHAEKLENDHFMWYIARLHANQIRAKHDGPVQSEN